MFLLLRSLLALPDRTPFSAKIIYEEKSFYIKQKLAALKNQKRKQKFLDHPGSNYYRWF